MSRPNFIPSKVIEEAKEERRRFQAGVLAAVERIADAQEAILAELQGGLRVAKEAPPPALSASYIERVFRGGEKP